MPLLAEIAAAAPPDRHVWPDAFDSAATATFLTVVVAGVAAGYVLMGLDIRAYLRSLRRTLIVVVNYMPHMPRWAWQKAPACLAAFGLHAQCTEEDLLRAYRQRVKRLHPDRGGDRRRFIRLQRDFELALAYLRAQQPSRDDVLA